jgi:hypothetical protein
MRFYLLKLICGSSLALLKLSQPPFLGLVCLGKDMHFSAHLFIETPHLILKLFDCNLVLSLLFGPIFMILLDNIVVFLLNLSYILTVA